MAMTSVVAFTTDTLYTEADFARYHRANQGLKLGFSTSFLNNVVTVEGGVVWTKDGYSVEFVGTQDFTTSDSWFIYCTRTAPKQYELQKSETIRNNNLNTLVLQMSGTKEIGSDINKGVFYAFDLDFTGGYGSFLDEYLYNWSITIPEEIKPCTIYIPVYADNPLTNDLRDIIQADKRVLMSGGWIKVEFWASTSASSTYTFLGSVPQTQTQVFRGNTYSGGAPVYYGDFLRIDRTRGVYSLTEIGFMYDSLLRNKAIELYGTYNFDTIFKTINQRAIEYGLFPCKIMFSLNTDDFALFRTEIKDEWAKVSPQSNDLFNVCYDMSQDINLPDSLEITQNATGISREYTTDNYSSETGRGSFVREKDPVFPAYGVDSNFVIRNVGAYLNDGQIVTLLKHDYFSYGDFAQIELTFSGYDPDTSTVSDSNFSKVIVPIDVYSLSGNLVAYDYFVNPFSTTRSNSVGSDNLITKGWGTLADGQIVGSTINSDLSNRIVLRSVIFKGRRKNYTQTTPALLQSKTTLLKSEQEIPQEIIDKSQKIKEFLETGEEYERKAVVYNLEEQMIAFNLSEKEIYDNIDIVSYIIFKEIPEQTQTNFVLSEGENLNLINLPKLIFDNGVNSDTDIKLTFEGTTNGASQLFYLITVGADDYMVGQGQVSEQTFSLTGNVPLKELETGNLVVQCFDIANKGLIIENYKLSYEKK